MKRLMPLAVTALVSLIQGCATSPSSADAAQHAPQDVAQGAGVKAQRVANRVEVPVEKNAPVLDGHPLTSVVVTQCNLLVAVYVTMPDGKLLRFDRTAGVPSDQLLTMAYAATRSERVEVSCENTGVVGYEQHSPL